MHWMLSGLVRDPDCTKGGLISVIRMWITIVAHFRVVLKSVMCMLSGMVQKCGL